MNQTRVLLSFSNPGINTVQVCDLMPAVGGSTLEAIYLSLSGLTKAMMTSIVLRANGKIVWETDGAKIDAINQFRGFPTPATVLLLDFMEPSFRSINAFQSGAMDLSTASGINQLRLEITVVGGTTPVMTGYAEISPAMPIQGEEKIRFLFLRRHRSYFTVPSTNEVQLPIAHFDPASGGSVYKRIHFFCSNLTAIRVVRLGIDEYKYPVAILNAQQTRAKRVTQAGLFVFDPVCDNLMDGRVLDTRPSSGISSAQFFATFSAGENVTIETEELLTLNNY
jgi:Viral coat protein P2 N-terminal domain